MRVPSLAFAAFNVAARSGGFACRFSTVLIGAPQVVPVSAS